MTPPRYPFVQIVCTEDQTELAADMLWSTGAAGVEERDGTTMTAAPADMVMLIGGYEDEMRADAALNHIGSTFEATKTFLVGDDWRHAWKAYFKASLVSPRLFLKPSWEKIDAPVGAKVLAIDPGAAFGSGIHETTRLCLQAIDTHLEAGQSVLDVGCGSGILAIAAKLLGAGNTDAFDIDASVEPIVRENAEINGVMFNVWGGEIEQVTQTYDLVLANMQTHILLPIRDALVAATGKRLLLSGVLTEDAERVTAAFEDGTSLSLLERKDEGLWAALLLERG